MKSVATYEATIYAGFRVGRSGQEPEHTFTLDHARAVVQKYVDEVGLCVTVTPTEYVYTNGGEPGCIVGLIHYPRFPSTPDAIRTHALILAHRLLVALRQFKVSVVLPGETIMLEEGDRGLDSLR